MKPVIKKEQYDAVLWMLVIAAICLVGMLVYFIWYAMTEPQINGTLVKAGELLGKRGWI